jgi:hypothetical protein
MAMAHIICVLLKGHDEDEDKPEERLFFQTRIRP